MAKKTRLEIFLELLGQIAAGKSDMEVVEDEETKELLTLAKTMKDADFSIDGRTKEKIRKQILAQVNKDRRPSSIISSRFEDELDEEALGHVAAGFEGRIDEKVN